MRNVALLVVLLLTSCCFGQEQTPEKVVQSFVEAINKKDFDAAAKLIKGGVVSPYLKEQPAGASMPKFSISNLASAPVGDKALVTYILRIEDGGKSEEMSEYLVLVKVGNDWLINPPMQGEGLVMMAFMLTNPPMIAQARASAQAAACLSNVKQVALAVIMFESDNDDVFKATAANWKAKIMPYVKNEGIFTCPLDPKGTMSYSVNPKLFGKSGEAIADPAATVLLYEGKNGELDFRHNGRAAVAFADGHAKLVTKEAAKTLNWKP